MSQQRLRLTWRGEGQPSHKALLSSGAVGCCQPALKPGPLRLRASPWLEPGVVDLKRSSRGGHSQQSRPLPGAFSLRSTLVTAISIPLSIVIALIGLWVGQYSLNLLTLSGLSIAVGRVVDDSIVVLENIYRHLRGGEDKRTAVMAGAKEVATAVTASTLTTVCVFLPLAFLGDIVGEYAHPLAFSVTIALLASLLVALTIIPVLAYWFLKAPAQRSPQKTTPPQPSLLERGYIPLVRWATRHRNLLISGDLAIIVIGGLTSSTVLTLLLVPTLYVIVEDLKERWRRHPTLPAGEGEQAKAVVAH